MPLGITAVGRRIHAAAVLLTYCCTAMSAGVSVAPHVSLPLATGGQISIEQLRGQVVLLNFWSSWCGPCRDEFPLLERLYRADHERGLVLIGVDIDTYPEDGKAFLNKHPVTFPIATDPESLVSSRFVLDDMPMSILIDRRGGIRWIHRGYAIGEDNEYAQQVDVLLREI